MAYVSIVICTRNRATALKDTLASLRHTSLPMGWSAELLVIDNGSTDGTDEVVAQAVFPHGPCRCVCEPKPGLSRARNRALLEARGDIFLFTDDDVEVPADWIGGMCEPLVAGDADAVAGGVRLPAALAYATAHPPLLPLRYWFACTDYLNPAKPECMVGANMAFHRRVLANVSRFDEQLGAGALGSFEETHFSRQIVRKGYRLVGRLDTTVIHHFDVSRLSRQHLLQAATRIGRSRAYVYLHFENRRSSLIWPRLVWSWLQVVVLTLVSPREQARRPVTLALVRATERLAFAREYLRQLRAAPPTTSAPVHSSASPASGQA